MAVINKAVPTSAINLHRSEFEYVVHILNPLVDGHFGGSNIVQSSGIANLRFLEKRLRAMNILAVPTGISNRIRLTAVRNELSEHYEYS
jgi:hypothetical protein